MATTAMLAVALLLFLATTGHAATLTSTQPTVRLRHNNFHCFNDRPVLENGYYEAATEDGHVIKPRCDTGYRLVNDEVRMCNETEKRFTGSEPHCADVDECVLLSNDPPSDVISSGMTSDEDDLMACHSEALCINVIGSYRCQCNSGFHGDGFTCAKDQCVVPDPPSHGVIIPISSVTIRVFCHPDYSLHGHSIVSCDQGQWQQLPRCIPGWKSCGDPGVPENGYRKGNRFQVGSNLHFYCRSGFQLQGSRLRMCLEPDLQWTGAQPTCTEITKERTEDGPSPALSSSEKILHREKRI